jgi:hypothetical protein
MGLPSFKVSSTGRDLIPTRHLRLGQPEVAIHFLAVEDGVQ